MSAEPNGRRQLIAASEPRMQLNPDPPASSYLDGSWWPRSTRLALELPELIATLANRLGPVLMVGYHTNAWSEVPPQIQIGGSTVQLQCFTSQAPPSLILIGRDGRRVTLRVIAPDASEQEVQTERDRAAEHAVGLGFPSNHQQNATVRALSEVAAQLAQHEGRHDSQRDADIKRWCDEAAEQFTESPVQAFVPILVEHIVRNRMDAASPAG